MNWLVGWRESRCGVARLKNLAMAISFFVVSGLVRKDAEQSSFQADESILLKLASCALFLLFQFIDRKGTSNAISSISFLAGKKR